ncbi:MAG: oxidoreductase [Terracidiphilus sp.]|jgi:NAD(P)-dependent dehydrogenase (short-subunit alcohol dehydrogenase family)
MSQPGSPAGMRLKDKVILVTGSTTGIGEAIVRLFAREGAQVMVHGRRKDAAQKLAAEIGERASFVIGALEDPEIPAMLVAETIARFGRIDGLVNNAAVVTHGGIEDTDTEAFDRTLAINLRAPLFLIQAALPHFRKEGGGRVLNIGSINAYCGERILLAYSISKGGLMTLTRNLADAHGVEGIQINQLNVGWTLTPNEYALKLKDGLSEDWPTKLPKSVAPSGRIHSPNEVASAAVYFLSDEAALINGSILDVEQFPVIGRNPVKEAS